MRMLSRFLLPRLVNVSINVTSDAYTDVPVSLLRVSQFWWFSLLISKIPFSTSSVDAQDTRKLVPCDPLRWFHDDNFPSSRLHCCCCNALASNILLLPHHQLRKAWNVLIKEKLSTMTVPSMSGGVNWQFLLAPLHRNSKLPERLLSDFHYVADGLHHDFPSIICRAGSFDWFPATSTKFSFHLLFPTEFIDIGTVVHHLEVNH